MLTILAIAALTLYVSRYISHYTDDGILSITIEYYELTNDLKNFWSLTKAVYEWAIELATAVYGFANETVIPMLPVQSKDESQVSSVDISDDELLEGLELASKGFQLIHSDDFTDEELNDLYNEEEQADTNNIEASS